MKRLFLGRHASALNLPADAQANSDYERHLSARGEIEAQNLAHAFVQAVPELETICYSPATRTQQTAKALAAAYQAKKIPVAMEEVNLFYNATVDTLLQSLHQRVGDESVMLCIGHNNGISDFANHLTLDVVEYLSPADVVELIFPDCEDWLDIQAGAATLGRVFHTSKSP